MTHQVELSSPTFRRLQKLATPLVDTIETVINRLLDQHEQENLQHRMSRELDPASKPAALNHPVSPPTDAATFDPASPPDLRHTKVLSARLDGSDVDASWNALLVEAIKRARARGHEELRRVVIVNYVRGRKEDEGYKYLADVGISVQGQDANGAWRGTFHIAQQLGLGLEVDFVWRHKDGAARPGEFGTLRLSARPTTTAEVPAETASR